MTDGSVCHYFRTNAVMFNHTAVLSMIHSPHRSEIYEQPIEDVHLIEACIEGSSDRQVTCIVHNYTTLIAQVHLKPTSVPRNIYHGVNGAENISPLFVQ
jgi:hypothetical protein